ncbi:hypothetical protein ACQKWADRAFT_298804 [Trichoderma austrokoningii]
MAPKNGDRKRDRWLKPFAKMSRSRSSSSAAREDLSTTSRTSNASRLEILQKPSTHTGSSSSPSLSPSVQSQLSLHLTVTSPEPQTVSDASKSSPSQSSDLWSQAFRKANDTTQKWLKGQGLDIHSPGGMQAQNQVKDIISLMENKELPQNASEPLTIAIANRKIIVREFVADAIALVKLVGDTAIAFAPHQASAPWAVAKAVLKIPVKGIEQKAALFGTIEWFTRITRRGQIYESLYTKETTDEGAVSSLHNALLELYTAALELLAKFVAMAEGGAFKEILTAVASPNYATDLVSNLNEKEGDLDREVRSCNASRSAISSEEIKDQIKALQKHLDQLSSPLPRIDKTVSTLLEKVNKQELEALMDFISSEMFGKSHAAVTDARIEKTGEWLLSNEDFRAWQSIPSSSATFILKGAGGTGKTYLTSKVIDHVRQILEISPHDEGFAYFYCNRSGSQMQQPLVVLQSFVRQLSGKAFDESGAIQTSLRQRCLKARKEMRELGYKDCEELILESFNLYSKTTIILDALDESDIETYNLAKSLIQITEKSKRPVKIFISSRPDREYLAEVFKEKFLIAVDANNQHDDIQKYLEDKLYSTEKFKRRKREIQGEIKGVFNTKGGGMFRWVYLQVKSLEKCVSDDAVHNWTQKLPRDLKEAYNQIWENIQECDESDVALAERAIKWVLCSPWPLKSEELLGVIRYVIEGSTVVKTGSQSQQDILSLCQDLLTVDEERGVWMLPHASVAEYFESKGWTGEKCDAFAAKTCLGILENPPSRDFSEDLSEDSSEDFSEDFHDEIFADEYWHYYTVRYDKWLGLREEEVDSSVAEALKRFLGSPNESSDSYREWVQRYHDNYNYNNYNYNYNHNKDRMKPANMALFAMCRFGLYYTLRDWWLGGKITQEMALQKNEYGRNSLALAAEGGCIPICRHLMSLIDVTHPEARRHAGALMSALEKDNDDILKLLVLEANADVNFPGDDYGRTAATYAAIHRPEMLQWMVDHSLVDLEKENESGLRYGNPLIAAVSMGDIESVQILLAAGAGVNAAVQNGRYGSALVAAVAGGDEEVVKLLLDSGADPNLPLIGGEFGSALEAAAWWLYLQEKMYHMLLEAGADPAASSKLGKHGSPLAAAAFYGQKDFLEAMIDRVGVDKAIDILRQSRHPEKRFFQSQEEFKRWKDTVAYLANEVGARKDVLHAIGLWDVEPVPYGWDTGWMQIQFSDYGQQG